jgi:hypothetical protein
MPRERAVIPCRSSGALRWVLFRLRSRASPTGVLPLAVSVRVSAAARVGPPASLPSWSAPSRPRAWRASTSKPVTGAGVQARRRVSRMTGLQLQAARMLARVVAPVVDWTAGAGAGGGGGGLGAGRPGGAGVGAAVRGGPSGRLDRAGAARGAGGSGIRAGGERTGHGWTPGRELGVLTRCLTVGGVQHDAGDGGGSAARRGETLPTPAKVSVTPTAVPGF